MNVSSKNDGGRIDPEDCMRVLEGAAASSHLKRAARLREFLLYIGRKAIDDQIADLHEQKIGHAVFGREEFYDTSQDNIVRVSATELRKRVDTYFATEGKDEAVIFEIPRGSYTPVFRLRVQERSTDADRAVERGSDELAAARASLRRARLALAVVSVVAAALAIACIVLWWQVRAMR